MQAKRKYILYKIKETNQKKRYIPQNNENTFRNIVRVVMFHQRLTSKHYRMRDLKLAAQRSASGYRQGKKTRSLKNLKPRSFNSLTLTKNPATFSNNVFREIITRKQLRLETIEIAGSKVVSVPGL